MSSARIAANPAALDGHIDEVIRSAQHELTQLLAQRSALMRRIGTVKQTLVYLARVFGEDVLGPEAQRLLGHAPPRKQPGLTRACRTLLMEATVPLEARQALRELQRRFPGLVDHHKIPLASVTTVFNRLVASGEARSFPNGRGRRAWEWVADAGPAAEIRLAAAVGEGLAHQTEPITEQ